MAARVRFVYNPAIEAYIRTSPLLEPQLAETLRQKEALAKSIAPVNTGAFAASIKGEVLYEGGTIRGRLSADVRYAIYLEFGTSDTPTFATLRTAMNAHTGSFASVRRSMG